MQNYACQVRRKSCGSLQPLLFLKLRNNLHVFICLEFLTCYECFRFQRLHLLKGYAYCKKQNSELWKSEKSANLQQSQLLKGQVITLQNAAIGSLEKLRICFEISYLCASGKITSIVHNSIAIFGKVANRVHQSVWPCFWLDL